MECPRCKKQMKGVCIIDGLGYYDALVCDDCQLSHNLTKDMFNTWDKKHKLEKKRLAYANIN